MKGSLWTARDHSILREMSLKAESNGDGPKIAALRFAKKTGRSAATALTKIHNLHWWRRGVGWDLCDRCEADLEYLDGRIAAHAARIAKGK